MKENLHHESFSPLIAGYALERSFIRIAPVLTAYSPTLAYDVFEAPKLGDGLTRHNGHSYPKILFYNKWGMEGLSNTEDKIDIVKLIIAHYSLLIFPGIRAMSS